MKKVTYNAHPKLIQKGFQEKVKQTKEKMIGNQDSADCFKRALKFERIFQFLLPQSYLDRGGSKIWKDFFRNIVVIFQTNILKIVRFYVRHSANVCIIQLNVSSEHSKTKFVLFRRAPDTIGHFMTPAQSRARENCHKHFLLSLYLQLN